MPRILIIRLLLDDVQYNPRILPQSLALLSILVLILRLFLDLALLVALLASVLILVQNTLGPLGHDQPGLLLQSVELTFL